MQLVWEAARKYRPHAMGFDVAWCRVIDRKFLNHRQFRMWQVMCVCAREAASQTNDKLRFNSLVPYKYIGIQDQPWFIIYIYIQYVPTKQPGANCQPLSYHTMSPILTLRISWSIPLIFGSPSHTDGLIAMSWIMLFFTRSKSPIYLYTYIPKYLYTYIHTYIP